MWRGIGGCINLYEVVLGLGPRGWGTISYHISGLAGLDGIHVFVFVYCLGLVGVLLGVALFTSGWEHSVGVVLLVWPLGKTAVGTVYDVVGYTCRLELDKGWGVYVTYCGNGGFGVGSREPGGR